jgi:hypothetical protein
VRSLDLIAEQGYEVLPEMRERVISLASAVFDDNTVYASPAVGHEGEISLHWVADKRSMEIELIPGDEWYYFIGDNGNHFSEQGTGPMPEKMLREQIADFSAFVFAANPKWRDTLANQH